MSDKFQTFCFSHSGSWFLPFLWLSLLAGLSACSWTGDDRSDCPSGFRIRLQPALHAQIQPDSGTGVITDEIDTLSLYVFDAQGQFVCLHTENRQSLTENDYIITLPLEYKDGDVYELVFWAGGDNRHYRMPQLTPGSSTRDELTLRLERDGDGRQDDELGHLWYGHLRLSRIQPSELTSVSVPMLKDSNRFVITLHDTSGQGLDADDYDFTLLADNGRMNADNEVMTGDRVTCRLSYRVRFRNGTGRHPYGRSQPGACPLEHTALTGGSGGPSGGDGPCLGAESSGCRPDTLSADDAPPV